MTASKNLNTQLLPAIGYIMLPISLGNIFALIEHHDDF